MKSEKVLIIGGDSRLGKSIRLLTQKKPNYIFTTRRKTHEKEDLYFEIGNSDSNVLTKLQPKTAVMCAGITDYKKCERNLEDTRKINVTETMKVCKKLIEEGTHVVFISTNTVLGDLKDRSEYGQYKPHLNYSKQKAEVEKELLALNGLQDQITIIRLTKHVSKDTSPFGDWIEDLSKGKQIKAFSDLICAPITFQRSATAIVKITDQKQVPPGIYHISGESDIDYVELAKLIAVKLGKDESLVKATTSTEQGLELLLKPKITRLDMIATKETIGEAPMPILSVVDELVRGE